MSNIIIKNINKNTYEIKIYKYLNIYNIDILQEIIKNIIIKIKKKNQLKQQLVFDIYPSNYETIILLEDYNPLINISNTTEVKVNIHTDTTFLYEIDYPINNNNLQGDIYYYKNKFYLKIKDIDKNNYLYLSEYSKLIYKNTDKILEEGLKIKI